MIGYSAKEIFKPFELALFQRARALVTVLSDTFDFEIRCHELARAVGEILRLDVQDGYYGFVDHTWLWTSPLVPHLRAGRSGFSNILDVYSVGQLPMVRLIDGSHTSLPHVGWSYRPGNLRDDIQLRNVGTLAAAMLAAEASFGESKQT
jgi:hypothetical protein